MMNNPYNLHSWSKDYRAQVMDTARRRDLIERARRETHGLRRLDLTWRNALAPLLRRTRTAG
jgi:hypothetical protein